MKLTNIIKDIDPISIYVIIVDKDGNTLRHVKEYNIETKEAVIYKFGEDKRVVMIPNNPENPSLFKRFEGDIYGFTPATEKVILEGLKLMFIENGIQED